MQYLKSQTIPETPIQPDVLGEPDACHIPQEIIAEKTSKVKGKIIAMTTVLRDYASNIEIPDKRALSEDAQSILDKAYTALKELYSTT